MAGRSMVRTALVACLGGLVALLTIGFAATSASAAETRVWLTTLSGTPIPDGGAVAVGQTVTVHVQGFNPNAAVVFQLGDTELPFDTTTNASGSAAVQFTVPKVAPDGYLLTASSDQVTATTAVTVKTAGTTVSTPTPSATASAPPSTPSSSAALAHTGAPATIPTTLWAAVLLTVGAVMIKVGAPVLRGRHERLGDVPVRIAGRHAR